MTDVVVLPERLYLSAAGREPWPTAHVFRSFKLSFLCDVKN